MSESDKTPENPNSPHFLEGPGIIFNKWLTYAQAVALVAIALAAVAGIAQSIWEMSLSRNISLGDLLMLFLYIAVISMVKGACFGTREIPIHTPIALAIVAGVALHRGGL